MEQYRIDKANRIAAIVTQCAARVARLLPVAYPRKRPRMCKRMPARAHAYRKRTAIKIKQARIELPLLAVMASAQMSIALSQPIPRFRPGGIINDNPAIANENGQEEIIRASGTAGEQK